MYMISSEERYCAMSISEACRRLVLAAPPVLEMEMPDCLQ